MDRPGVGLVGAKTFLDGAAKLGQKSAIRCVRDELDRRSATTGQHLAMMLPASRNAGEAP